MHSRDSRALVCYLVLMLALSFVPAAQAQSVSQVDVLTVEGAITPVVASYVDRGIETAENDGSACLIIELDTPGGSVPVSYTHLTLPTILLV